MESPYNVSLDLFRGAAIRPFRRQTLTVPARSALDACHRAETALNVSLPDVEYAAASGAAPVWEPRPHSAVLPAPLAA